jgi:hypothetical protein
MSMTLDGEYKADRALDVEVEHEPVRTTLMKRSRISGDGG